MFISRAHQFRAQDPKPDPGHPDPTWNFQNNKYLWFDGDGSAQGWTKLQCDWAWIGETDEPGGGSDKGYNLRDFIGNLNSDQRELFDMIESRGGNPFISPSEMKEYFG